MATQEVKVVLTAENKLGGVVRQVSADLDKLKSKEKDFEGAFKAMAVAGVAAFAGLALAVKASVRETIEAEAAHNRLAHILRTSRGATDAQIAGLNVQAEALEQLGVVSSNYVTIAQSQLATFDLSAAAIERLTPAVLDYAVAEKGASVSAEELKQMTNGLAQALQGNFTSLTKTGFVLDDATKKLIENGTEAQRTAALVKVLNSTYKGFNEMARETAEGKLKVLNNEFARMKEAIGNALLPTIIKLVDTITPLIKRLTEWIDKHPALTKGIVAVMASLAALVAVAGTAGTVIYVLSGAVAAATAAVTIAIAPWVALAAAVAYVAKLFSDHLTQGYRNQIALDEELMRANNELADGLIAARKPIQETAQGFSEMSDKAKDAVKDIEKLNKEIAKTNKEHNERMQQNKLEIGTAFVDQMEKIGSLEKDIQEEKNQALLAEDKTSHYERIGELENQLSAETEAFFRLKEQVTGIDAEINEARRRSLLTEFENRVETLLRERIAEMQRHVERLQQYQVELAELRAHHETIMAEERAFTAKYKAEDDARVSAVEANTRRITNALQQRSMMGIPSIPATGIPTLKPRAEGGSVTGGNPYLVGERGAELFVPNTSGTIVPNNKMGGITVNVYNPTLLDEVMVSKLSDLLGRQLRQQFRV